MFETAKCVSGMNATVIDEKFGILGEIVVTVRMIGIGPRVNLIIDIIRVTGHQGVGKQITLDFRSVGANGRVCQDVVKGSFRADDGVFRFLRK